MKIDIHTHIMPKQIPNWANKFGYGDFIHLQHDGSKPCCARMMKGDKFFREVEENCWDGDVRIIDMEKHSVTQQVLSTIPVLFNYWAKPKDAMQTSQYFNDHIAEVCSRHSSRFFGIGTVPLQDVDLAITEMERCMTILNLKGIEIGTNVNQENLGDAKYYPFFEAAERLGAAIFIHPWEMMGEDQYKKYWLPWLVGMPAESSRAICSLIFSGTMERLPNLRLAFAHGGGSFPYTFGRIAHGFDCRPDLVAIDNPIHPKNYIGKFYLDALTHDAASLDYIVKMFGEDKICMGTDYPFPLGEDVPGALIESMMYSKEAKEKLLYKNALNWLNGSI
jgi:aminocarboxymuconate-semialdehyde decarboxylase